MKQPIFKGSKPEKNPNTYANDGYGRDAYISYNNGGNFQTEFRFLVSPKDRSGPIMMPSPNARSQNFCQRIFYQCDGTGRDTYVYSNVREKFSSGVNYKNMLRSSEQFFSPPKVRYELPPLARERFRRTCQSQSNLTKRLSMPKKQSIS